MSDNALSFAPVPPEPWADEDAPVQVPQSREAEEALIGAVMIDPELLHSLPIEPEDFYLIRHKSIWTAFREMERKQQSIDFVTVTNALDAAGTLSEVGGPAYLTALINTAPSIYNVAAYADIVLEKATRRRAIESAQKLLKAAFDESEDLSVSVDQVVGELRASGNFAGEASSSDEIHSEFTKVVSDPFKSLSSGIPEIDNTLGKFFPTEETIFASRPGVGKSAITSQIARGVALSKRRVLVFSTEMKKISWWGRFACPMAGTTWQEVRSMDVVPPQLLAKIEAESKKLAALYGNYLYVNDRVKRPQDMRRIAERYRPELVIVDHLGEMEWPNPKLKKIEWFGLAATYLRDQIAQTLPCHVVLVAQLNRAVESRQNSDRVPQLHDLRECGELEQIADAVLMGYRPDMYNPTAYQGTSIVPAEWWTRKNRFGKVNACATLLYDLRQQWFDSPTQRP